ncbi:UTRA domain-containing protein [Sphingomonas silueang]|uniref:UTRA domain-containing protein n=1 Tax=Sphingomonas silueang TaxID=3156617 RepID=UPI0032B3DCA5
MIGAQAASLHSRIRSEIERQIMAGELKPGDRIPFEHELMVRYDCSRMTVNKALTALSNAGLIERRRRAGSFVAPQRVDMAALAIPDIRAEIEGRGAVYRLELLSRSIVRKSRSAAVAIDAPAGADVLQLVCRHLAGEEPFAVEHRLINLRAVPAARGVDFAVEPPGTWLIANIPWTEAENRILANLAGEDAVYLDTAPGVPCLTLERRTWQAGQAITHVRQIFPGSGFSLVARFHST